MDLLNLPLDMLSWLSPSSQGGLADYALFRLISGWITTRVEDFGLALMGRSMSFVGGVGFSFALLWLVFQGYRILGGAREPMMGTVLQGARMAVIFGIATTMAVNNISLNSFLTKDMDKAIHELVTGKKNQTTANSIDKSLAVVQLAITAIDGVQLLEADPELLEEKRSAKAWATMGSAGPAIAAGCMLLLWTFALNLWIGLGPIFIFALAFPATKSMFTSWLKYGIGTLFSLAVLSFVANLLLDLTVRIATFMWLAKLANIPGLSAEGITNQAMQQGSVGMIMTVLIISVPPMAAHFFQGQIGNFVSSSAFGRWGQGGGGGGGGPSQGPPPAVVNPVQDSSRGNNQTPQTTYSHMNRSVDQATPKHENRVKSADEVRKE
ncbi:type IV secretion system protein [Pseudomonas sp. CGJS7]|uniref:type IV secretion system protein n=1 Tax=Pseudomonas sp. CGJS7 TaxID=3109348 RepID=UPI0030086A35